MHQIADQTIDIELLQLIAAQKREIVKFEAAAEASAAQARRDKDALKVAVKRLNALIDETIADRPLFNRPVEVEERSELDVSQGDPAVFNSRGFVKPAEQTSAAPALCLICGGVADKPYTARRKNSKKACHFSADGKVRSLKDTPESIISRELSKPAEIETDIEKLLEAESDEDAAEAELEEAEPDGGRVEDDWRSLPVKDAVAEPMGGVLHARGVRTVGKLSDYLSALPTFDLCEPDQKFGWRKDAHQREFNRLCRIVDDVRRFKVNADAMKAAAKKNPSSAVQPVDGATGAAVDELKLPEPENPERYYSPVNDSNGAGDTLHGDSDSDQDESDSDAEAFEDVEVIDVPIPKTCGCKTQITVAKGNDGLWRTGFRVTMPMSKGGYSSAPVGVGSPESRTREVAIAVGCEHAVALFKRYKHLKAKRCVEEFARNVAAKSSPGVHQVATGISIVKTPTPAGGLEQAPQGQISPPRAAEPKPLVDDWQSVGVADLELIEQLVDRLVLDGIETAGELREAIENQTLEAAFVGLSLKTIREYVRDCRNAIAGVQQPAEPEPPRAPAEKQTTWFVLNGPPGGPYEQVTHLVDDEPVIKAQSIDEAIKQARKAIGWQVHNFHDGLVIRSKKGQPYRVSADGKWLEDPAWRIETPDPGEFKVCGSNETLEQGAASGSKAAPRTYEVVEYNLGRIEVLTTVKASTRANATTVAKHWRQRHRPHISEWKLDVRPIEDAKAEKKLARRDKSKRQLAAAVNRVTPEEREKIIALESTPPDKEAS